MLHIIIIVSTTVIIRNPWLYNQMHIFFIMDMMNIMVMISLENRLDICFIMGLNNTSHPFIPSPSYELTAHQHPQSIPHYLSFRSICIMWYLRILSVLNKESLWLYYFIILLCKYLNGFIVISVANIYAVLWYYLSPIFIRFIDIIYWQYLQGLLIIFVAHIWAVLS